MPIPIAKLFEGQSDADIHCMPRPKDVKDMAMGWQRIPLSLGDIPDRDWETTSQ